MSDSAVSAQSAKAPATAASKAKAVKTPSAGELRDMMPFFSQEPTLVGDDLVFELNVAPMRDAATKGSGLLDRVGGRLTISRKGVNMMSPGTFADGSPVGKVLMARNIPTREVTKAGAQQFKVALPPNVADELRAVPKSKLMERVRVVMRNDKDIDASTPGYERQQLMSSFMVPSFKEYLASKRPENVVSSSGIESRSKTRSRVAAQAMSAPGTWVVYNGSPFDLEVSMNIVQCIEPFLSNWAASPGAVPSNTSFEFPQVAAISGDIDTVFVPDASNVNSSATNPMSSLGESTLSAIGEGALVYHITESASAGLMSFGTKMAFSLILNASYGAIVNSNACANAGSAISMAWTNVGIGASQTAGNVSYYAPGFNRTNSISGVSPSSLPALAPGSPLTAYQATSGNGLAVAASALQSQIGMQGSVLLSTLNQGQCDYKAQQTPNLNSTGQGSAGKSQPYGASALMGGTTPDWGPCDAVAVTGGDDDENEDYYATTNTGDLSAESMSILIGYATTTASPSGPYPVNASRSAANSSMCVSGTSPCIYATTPTSATTSTTTPTTRITSPLTTTSATTNTDLTVGCTPGDWNLITPWNNANISLTSPPSYYSSQSYLNTTIAYTGITASGAATSGMAIPMPLGTVTSSFSPDTVNSFVLTPQDLSALQATLGGPGGYVTNWLCVFSAYTLIPTGIAASGINPGATQMNLGWYGTPVAAAIPNPAGNILSPPE